MLEHSQHCDLVAGQITSTMPIIMPAPLSAWNLYGDPRLVTIRRVNIPNSSFSKCDMCPYFGGVEESQVNQDSLFEGGRPHIGRPHWLQDFRESCIKCDCWVRDQRGSLLESHQARTHHHLPGGDAALNVSYWRYIVMLISCDFQNIVEISLSHFFWPYHKIFLGHFYPFLACFYI